MDTIKAMSAPTKTNRNSTASLTRLLLTTTVVLTLAAVAAMAALALYGVHGGVFQHHNAVLVDRLTNAEGGLRVTVTEKKSTADGSWRPGTVYRGVLLPTTSESAAASSASHAPLDGRLSYVYRGNEFNFTVLDDRGFVTVADEHSGALEVSRCMQRAELPPLPLSVQSLADALMRARVVDDVGSHLSVECDLERGDRLVEMVVAGEPFVFCSETPKSAADSVSDNKVHVLHGSDVQIEVEFLSESSASVPSRQALLPPRVPSASTSQYVASIDLSTCDPLKATTEASAKSVSSGLRDWLSTAMQRADDVMRLAIRGEARRALSAESDLCSCTSPKICLFVHGLGRANGSVTTSDSDYWGDIDQDATCCSSTTFMHLDTRNTPWYDDSVTSQFCSTALSVSGGSDAQSIANVAVVAHSMGNLIVASALQKGTCALASTSKWIALSPPTYGSMTATTILETWSSLSTSVQTYVCGGNDDMLSTTLYKALAKMGLCGNLATLKSLAYDGSSESTTDLSTLYAEATAVFASKVTNVMCGINSYGITSTDSLFMVALDEFSDHASSNNDAMVEYESCRGTLSADQFDGDWDDGGGFYRANLNHRDTSFRNGNAVFGDSRKPVKWFNCQFD